MASHVVARTANGASSDVVLGELSPSGRDDEAPWLRDGTRTAARMWYLEPSVRLHDDRVAALGAIRPIPIRAEWISRVEGGTSPAEDRLYVVAIQAVPCLPRHCPSPATILRRS